MRFDLWAINRFYSDTIQSERLFDTLVAARLMDPEQRSNTLEDWGRRLECLKGEYKGDFSTFDDELVTYARQDIVVTRALYHKVKHVEQWGSCCRTEMLFAYVMALQEAYGFRLDVPAAQRLDAELRAELLAVEAELKNTFPPIAVPKDKAPFVPKKDDPKRGYKKGVPVTRMVTQEFNPGSRVQVAGRLKGLGWVPKEFTPDGHAKVSDTILNELPYPEAKPLARYFSLQKRLGQISDGKNGWLKLVTAESRVHGRVNTLGCAPGRCSHNEPNMAQVNKKDHRMRAVWIAPPGMVLVGVDAEGLQARGCAHYLAKWDNGEFAKRVSEGRKEDGTDVHSANLEALRDEGLPTSRDGAKRALYACWFGARDPKLGWTLKDACRTAKMPLPKGADVVIGRRARKALNRAIRGFEDLCGAIDKAAKARKYLIGPDGRHVPVRSPHSALVFLTQAVEAAVMKLALVIFHYERAKARGWKHGVDYGYVANVHDEVQFEARPEIAKELGVEMADCIREAGVRLRLKCPLKGESKVGLTWAETH